MVCVCETFSLKWVTCLLTPLYEGTLTVCSGSYGLKRVFVSPSDIVEGYLLGGILGISRVWI